MATNGATTTTFNTLHRLIMLNYIAMTIIAASIMFSSTIQPTTAATTSDSAAETTTELSTTEETQTTVEETTITLTTTPPIVPLNEPTDVKVTALNDTTLEVTWSPVPDVFEYRILCQTECNVNVTTNENVTSYVIDELSPGTLYTIGVAACDEVDVCSNYSSASNNTFPSAPGPLTMLSSTNDSVTANWNQSGNFSDFIVMVNDTLTTSYSILSGSDDNVTMLISDLTTAGQIYCLKIAAVSFELASQTTSSSCQFATVPDAPGSLTSLGRTTNSLTVAWNQTGVVQSYDVTVNGTEQYEYVNYTGLTSAYVTAVVYNLAIPGDVYVISITAVSNNLSSQSVSSSDFVTEPLPPGSVVCGQATNSSVQVQISPPSANSSTYHIVTYQVVLIPLIGGYDQGGQLTVSYANMVVNGTYSNATSGVTYQMSVYSTVPGANSTQPQQVNCTAELNAPVYPTLGAVSTTTAMFSWSSPGGYFNGFVVNCNASTIYSNGAVNNVGILYGGNSSSSQVYSYTCSSLTAGAYYSITIDTFLNSSATPPVSSTALAATTEPRAPESVKLADPTASSLTLNIAWPYSVNQSQCSYFNVVANTSGDVTIQLPCPTVPGVTSEILVSLTSDALFAFAVTSVANNTTPVIESSSSNSNAWTLAQSVTNLELSSITQTSFVVSWSQPGPSTSITGYNITTVENGTTLQSNVIECTPDVPCTSYKVTNLAAASAYTVYVQAINPGGNSAPNYIPIITPAYSSCDGGCIAGIVIGVICAILLIILIVYFVNQRRRKSPDRYRYSDNEVPNPAFVLNEDSSLDVRLMDFQQHVNELSRDSNLKFSDEYEMLADRCKEFGLLQTAAKMQENLVKNRFTNILPFDETRVKLIPVENEPGSDYINANYVSGFSGRREYIASQGPMRSTLDDYWRMIWEQNVSVIVMLTNLQENGREKCAQYWPNLDQSPTMYGDVTVKMMSEIKRGLYMMRVMEVSVSQHKRTVRQYHYAWPDFGVPDDLNGFLDFCITFRNEYPPSPGPNCLVHCSAGVGRTGVFLLVDRLLQHIRVHDTLNVFNTLLEMRRCRQQLVQTEAQYIFVHKCIAAAIARNHSGDDDALYMNLPDGRNGEMESPYMNYNGNEGRGTFG